MKKGDVYNQKLLEERTSTDEDAIGNLYYNNGYLFYSLDPVEVNIVGDSIDLEMRIFEGRQATINKVSINGNDRLYENVVRRELRTRPGQLFSREDLMRSMREIQQMGHFDPEQIQPDIQPKPEDGTVDIGYDLVSKANDQVEFSAGWGQTGIIGKLSLKFTNFSVANLLHPGENYRGILPQGDGQTLTISGPYRWATIGLTPDHVARATIDEVRAFYLRWYHPSNAILSVSADIDEERVFELAERYFAPIAYTPSAAGPLPAEPEQTAERRLEVERDVPATAVTVAYPLGDRLSRDFYLGDMASDILSGGDSARLYERLVKRDRLFSSVNAYITGDVDPGLFVLTGHLLPGRTVEEAEEAFAREIEEMQTLPASDYEIEKVKNKFEANALFGELNVMNKAMNLGYYEMLGDPGLVNREVELYRSVTAAELTDFARRTFRAARRSTLIYRATR